MKIYLAISGVDFESETVMRAFKKEEDAKKFINDCIEYQKTMPPWPNDFADQTARIEFSKQITAWSTNHPAGSGTQDYFSVSETELYD
jgi:hypothetical protein